MVIGILRAAQQRTRADPRGKQRKHQHERRQRPPGNQVIGLGFYFAQPRERNNQKSQNNGADHGGVQMNHEFPSLFVMVSVRANGTTGNRSSAKRFLRCAIGRHENGCPILCAAKGGKQQFQTVNRSRTCAILAPATRTTLLRDCPPLTISIAEGGTSNNSAKNRTSASLALPSTGSSQRDLQYLVSQNARNRRSAGPRLHPYLK